ncbi:serine/threonine protein kinase [Mycobacterium kansasii]|uniref:non-specific serine/threonine protein kinase n=1 Tax=Mycobacterium innocens TaxID=2341083 RepID=A0A498Q241_9MYCO|nr:MULTISPECIES: protein kinase [Mycobacterium]KZS63723.1 serine/threonine protein kinase [Mycobacterium kansasii]VBA38984.1 Serine/threonine-protein kinase PknF [Mycobacterium innocens]
MPTGAGQSEGLSEGELFAGYTIVRRLGAGGMGEVYLAQHPRLPRRDALKILPRELTGDFEFRQRFNREADLAASLYNEHIVGIHDRGEFQGQLWISMDYVEGTDAAQLLRSRYPSGMPHTDVVQIIWAVADALDYAHSRGLLHRDVKPANILLGEATPRRRILLADFGIARQLGEISGLTATNMLMGTTAYCAPEQLQGADLDGRADQYALGCTAFHLLAGSAPFQHSNAAVVISQHLSSPPPSISTRRPELAHLDGVIAKALAKDPAERYPTCADFAAALAGRPGTCPAPVTSPATATELPTQVITSPAASPNPSSSRVKPATVVAALITVALVVVAVVLGVRLLRSPSADPGSGAQSPSTASPSGGATATSTPALRLSNYLTDDSNVLTPAEHAVVDRALTKLYNQRGIRLWVVYVKDFGGLKPVRWAENTMRANGFADADAMLAVATDGPAFSFRAPAALTIGRAIDVEVIRRDRIEPAVFRREWTRAALAAANGLDVAAR